MKLFILIFSLMLCFICLKAKKLPESLEHLRCSLKNDFKKCFLISANEAIPLVVGGIPDYKIPKMNPFSIPFIQLISLPTLGLNLTNIKVYGLENMRVKDANFDWVKKIYPYYFHCDKIKIEGEYAVDGKIMVLPIKGNGPFQLIFHNGMYNLTMNSNIIERNSEKYYHVLEARLDYQFDRVEFDFKNLFDGNKQLGDEMNKFLNENWEPLLSEFGPGIAKTISSILADCVEAILSQIPISDLFY